VRYPEELMAGSGEGKSYMDEATKAIIAYASLIIGLPLFVAKIVWFIPSAVSGRILSRIATRLDKVVEASFEGLISILIACLLFDHLLFHITLAVPIILITVNALWEWSKDETVGVWPASVAMAVGFYYYPRLFELLANNS
jgi:hypothetical protein